MSITVSIVTISNYSRNKFLRILKRCIANQDYTNITEWVIVDTSHVGYCKSEEDLSDLITEFRNDKLPKIVYYKSSKPNIGGWRNDSSNLVSGDIIVCMDDDDYYPPQRVSHVVERLKDKKMPINKYTKAVEIIKIKKKELMNKILHKEKLTKERKMSPLQKTLLQDQIRQLQEEIMELQRTGLEAEENTDTIEYQKVLLAGCDRLYLYDIYLNKLYQYRSYIKLVGPYHATNNTLAYWREYLDTHRYDEKVHNLEEISFTNGYSEPLIQLDPEKTIINISHDSNTFNKRTIIFEDYHRNKDHSFLIPTDEKFETMIEDKEIYQEYEKLFDQLRISEQSPYDIVYFMGISVIWNPNDRNLFGSEQAVKYLTMEWAKMGKKVAVYGNFTQEGNYQGVDYIFYHKFRFWDQFKTLILWRVTGNYPYLELCLKADKLFVDLHYHDPENYKYLVKNIKNITNVVVRSKYQYELIEQTISTKLPDVLIIPNGVNIEEFNVPISGLRNPYRMCYCSCYTRGLHRILNSIWPIIYQLEPRAELHVYYGMNYVENSDFINEIKQLLSQPGVMDHDRMPVEIISREKHMSSFQLYYTDFVAEVDCISIRESLVAGCIPIISDINLFKERDGIHLPWLPNTPDFNRKIACDIVTIINNEPLQQSLREKFYDSQTIISWNRCATEWIKFM